jgi:hypothetical protein
VVEEGAPPCQPVVEEGPPPCRPVVEEGPPPYRPVVEEGALRLSGNPGHAERGACPGTPRWSATSRRHRPAPPRRRRSAPRHRRS